MRQFTKLYMVFILLLIILGIAGFFIAGEPDQKQLEEEALNKAPGYETMTTVSEIVSKQQQDNALLDIIVTPKDENEEVLIQLHGHEQSLEKDLLLDSYHLLIELSAIKPINSLTISWFMLINNENVEALTMTFDRTALNTIDSHTFEELPTVASKYQKHEALNP
ncbi:hypothetical protein [Lysinibacillus sp. 54212]|uniref:hypothetical protein n=1 Tax=Lysinibacillus sp. 54212 TaxID=3119829 RepID=UPI002FC5B7DF